MKTNRLFSITSIALALSAGVLHAQPSDEASRYRMAQGYEKSGDLKNASRIYKELFDADPRSANYFEAVRRTYTAMLRFSELLPIVEERVKRDPKDLDLLILHADLLHRNQRRDEALEQWRAAIALQPEDAFVYAMVAQSQMDNRLFDRAIEVFLDARRKIGPGTLFSEQLAQVYGILGRYEDATAEYLVQLGENPSRLNFVMSGLGVFTTNPDGAAAAIRAVERASEQRSDYMPYLELLSWLYTEKGDYDGAFEIAKRLDQKRESRGSNIFAFADRALREGKYDHAVKAFDYFIATYPKNNPLYTVVMLSYTRALDQRYHARGEISRSDAEQLIERYRKIVGDHAGTPAAAEALLRVARLQADDLDEPEDALTTLRQLFTEYQRFSSLPEAMLFQGDLYLRTGDLAKAQEVYRTGAERAQVGSDAERYRDLSALRFAETIFYEGRFKDAVDAFTKLTENTASDATNDALGYLFILQENFEKFDGALSAFATGRLKLVQRKWEEAIPEMERAVTLGTGSTLADEALIGKAEAQEKLGAHKDAVATLLDIVTRYKDGTVTDRALFHAAEITERALNDQPGALALYTRVLTEYPSSSFIGAARQRIRALRGGS